MNPRKSTFRILYLSVFCLFMALTGNSALQRDTVSFIVSMEKPNTHYFHIEMECNGDCPEDFSFKMPTWTPGYYWMLNYAKNVFNFSATDVNANALDFVKTDLNTWQIQGIKNGIVKISYDVFAYNISVAESFLDDGRAFISPTGVFLFREEHMQNPVITKIIPYKNWTTVNTGLEKIKGRENTYFAQNFDVLYDCPILAGNMEMLKFDLDNIPYTIAMENPAEFDRDTYVGDFKKIVESATSLIGDIPYSHYSFLIMDKGMGGLEHTNSMAVFSNSNYDITNSAGYKGWLAFIAHEFFHLYNVKTIRPIELGPFDYCNPNITDMLWVAEGLTVYYEYLILNRSGLMSRQEVLDAYSRILSGFENANGRKHLTAHQASFDTWLNFFNWNNHTANTTISYYDIGCALGMLLDLKIRHETDNKKSLDDVMRSLYFDFHKKQSRGYSEEEFKQVCTEAVGGSLEEIFRYAETTDPIDYQKYLSYAGVEINQEAEKTISFGLEVRNNGDYWIISNIDRNSPAWENGLSIDDRIIEINGKPTDSEIIKALIKPKQANNLNLKIERRTGKKEFSLKTYEKDWLNYKMQVVSSLNSKQKSILESWIKE